MCFSADADLVAGIAVIVIGVDSVRHVTQPAERLLAALPLVFGGHQVIESFVWRSLEGDVAQSTGRAATWVYLAIAFGVVPVLVPLAVGALEPAPQRRRIAIFTFIGAFVALILMNSVVRGPVFAEVQGHHVNYTVDLWHGGIVVAFYVVATCGSLLASDHATVRRFGAVNLVAVGALAIADRTAFISLWCAWAAVTSLAIALHLRRSAPPPKIGPSEPRLHVC